MKAAVWTGRDKIEIKELAIPEIKTGEALIKVRAAGVCATDYHIISGMLKIGQPPNVQGHEICGEVARINGNSEIKVGQRCVIATSLGCRRCAYCKEGKEYLCSDGSEIGFYPNHGGYAEYVKVPISAIIPIPEEVTDLDGAILESAVCPTESLMRVGITFASSVIVTGAGPAALSYIIVAKAMGAGKITAIVRSEEKGNLVKKFGADEYINSKISDHVKILENSADVVIEATGAGEVIENAFKLCKKGGKILQYGIPADSEVINYPVKDIVTKEITVCGAVGNTKAWRPLIEMIKSGKLKMEQMVTHHFKIEDINKAFDLYRNHDKDLIKAVIRF